MAEQRRRTERTVDLERLRQRVEQDAGCAEFPALAEAERRAGRLSEARRIAERGLRARPDRLAGRVALGLALLDQGDVAGAQRELAAVFESERPLDEKPGLSAQKATRAPRRQPKAGEGERRAVATSAKTPLPVGEGSAFRTRTMARLLERQGDRGRAEEILEGLEGPVLEGADPADKGRDQAVVDSPDAELGKPESPSASQQKATLERWLRNVQRGRA